MKCNHRKILYICAVIKKPLERRTLLSSLPTHHIHRQTNRHKYIFLLICAIAKCYMYTFFLSYVFRIHVVIIHNTRTWSKHLNICMNYYIILYIRSVQHPSSIKRDKVKIIRFNWQAVLRIHVPFGKSSSIWIWTAIAMYVRLTNNNKKRICPTYGNIIMLHIYISTKITIIIKTLIISELCAIVLSLRPQDHRPNKMKNTLAHAMIYGE